MMRHGCPWQCNACVECVELSGINLNWGGWGGGVDFDGVMRHGCPWQCNACVECVELSGINLNWGGWGGGVDGVMRHGCRGHACNPNTQHLPAVLACSRCRVEPSGPGLARQQTSCP